MPIEREKRWATTKSEPILFSEYLTLNWEKNFLILEFSLSMLLIVRIIHQFHIVFVPIVSMIDSISLSNRIFQRLINRWFELESFWLKSTIRNEKSSSFSILLRIVREYLEDLHWNSNIRHRSSLIRKEKKKERHIRWFSSLTRSNRRTSNGEKVRSTRNSSNGFAKSFSCWSRCFFN